MISIGEELKREREFREISLREISDATKINIRMLEAIEKDNFGLLPGGIFNRNFIRAYAEFIGLDPEVIVRKYQVQTGHDQESKLPPNLVAAVEKDQKSRSVLRWTLLLIGMLIVLILSFLAWKHPEKLRLKSSRGTAVVADSHYA